MDTRSGEFVEEERAEAWMQRLAIGEIIKIKGEELEVVEIESRHVKLKLLSASDRFGKLFRESGLELASNRHERRKAESLRRKKG